MRYSFRFYAMPITPIHASPDGQPMLFQACRHQHRAWSAAIEQSQQEIEQLLIRLRDTPKQVDSPPLITQASPYYSTLKRLQYHFHRLQTDRVCQHTACLNREKKSCSKPRLLFLATLSMEEQLRSLTDELEQIRTALNRLS
jgi:hypothetical protein